MSARRASRVLSALTSTAFVLTLALATPAAAHQTDGFAPPGEADVPDPGASDGNQPAWWLDDMKPPAGV